MTVQVAEAQDDDDGGGGGGRMRSGGKRKIQGELQRRN